MFRIPLTLKTSPKGRKKEVNIIQWSNGPRTFTDTAEIIVKTAL